MSILDSDKWVKNENCFKNITKFKQVSTFFDIIKMEFISFIGGFQHET